MIANVLTDKFGEKIQFTESKFSGAVILPIPNDTVNILTRVDDQFHGSVSQMLPLSHAGGMTRFSPFSFDLVRTTKEQAIEELLAIVRGMLDTMLIFNGETHYPLNINALKYHDDQEWLSTGRGTLTIVGFVRRIVGTAQ